MRYILVMPFLNIISLLLSDNSWLILSSTGVTSLDSFFQWREADYTLVELLASSEGFNTADDALKNGITQGFKYLGVEHYSTSKNVSGHVFAEYE